MKKEDFFYFLGKYVLSIAASASLMLCLYDLFPNNSYIYITIPIALFVILGIIIDKTENIFTWDKITVILLFILFYALLSSIPIFQNYLSQMSDYANLENYRDVNKTIFEISIFLFIVQHVSAIINLFKTNYDDVKKQNFVNDTNNEITNLKQNIEKLNERTTKLEDQKEIQ